MAPFVDAAFGLTTLRLAPLGHAPLVLEPGHLRIGRHGRAGNAEQQGEAIDRELRPVRRDRSEPAAIGSVVEREPAPSVFFRETNGAVRHGVPNYPPGTGLVIEFSQCHAPRQLHGSDHQCTGRRASRTGRGVAVGAVPQRRHRVGARVLRHRLAGRSRRASTGSSGGAASSGWRHRWPSPTRAGLARLPGGLREGGACEDPGVHAAWPLVWTLNIRVRYRERSRSVHRVRHHHELRVREHTVRVDP